MEKLRVVSVYFFQDEIQYLSYKINKHRLSTSETKIKVIVGALIPTTIIQVDVPIIYFINDYFQVINQTMIQKETE